MRIIDITQEVFSCKVYPGDTAPSFKRVKSISEGEECNVTDFTMCAHNGTHIDAPFHYIDGGATIDELDVNSFIGKARVCQIEDFDGILRDTAEKRIIFKDCEGFTLEEAEALARTETELVGISGQSVGDAQVHQILLRKGIALLEGLMLDGVREGSYTLFAAPIKLGGADGAPVRALLLEE
ncbi:MAG: cyclase family protein [Clostridia bacterium]|nr:cyclase family protein [Clostridia bacterium]